jgi:hypothetical protein
MGNLDEVEGIATVLSDDLEDAFPNKSPDEYLSTDDEITISSERYRVVEITNSGEMKDSPVAFSIGFSQRPEHT